MNLKQYLELNDDEKKKICQSLSPYKNEDFEIFHEIQQLFTNQFNNRNIDKIKCGLYPGLGPYNCIKVFILRGRKTSKLPKFFLGFPVEKIYESKFKTYEHLRDEIM